LNPPGRIASEKATVQKTFEECTIGAMWKYQMDKWPLSEFRSTTPSPVHLQSASP
jgi:hypothetical protein